MIDIDSAAAVQLSPRLLHDLRTPINAILGYSDLLLDDAPDDTDLCDRVLPVRAAGDELNALVGLLPAAGVVELAWLASLQPPLVRLKAAVAVLKTHSAAPAEDVARIETACGRLDGMLASLAANESPVEPMVGAVSQVREVPVQAAPSGSLILVVDDNDLNRNLLGRRLQQLGHRVDEAGDGDTGLRMLHRRTYDLLLLDIVMPGLDGYEVLARLRADAELSRVPVLVISALTEMDSVARCIELGAVDFLPKNVDTVVLRARVNRSLEQKRARDREMSYLRDVAQLTAAAACVRDGQAVDMTAVERVGERSDDLGELARAFGRMVQEIAQREAALRAQLEEVQRLEVDAASRSQAVAAIAESEYFQSLRAKAQALKNR
ncbi:response regulator transcription factor [Immundisolibacter sp.]|uniref:response regulator transcription factor n=1 Tax=Immundisolibacter sp. TaxID=1934948 RepID=UPI0035660FBD